jgi:diketogulonate reductase-like aldo/keto reductase
MEYEILGKTGEEVPKVGIGTWKMGTDPAEEIKAIRKAIALNMRLVDTAEMYANEELVGTAIKGYGNVFVETKVSPNHLHYDDVIKACKHSLKRLGLKTVDLYMVHWPNPGVSIAETMSAMEHLVDAGMVRNIGVSNFSVKELDEAVHAMKKYDIASNQVEYSITVRDIERSGLLDYCIDSHITVVAYSPLSRGAIFSERQARLYGVIKRIAEAHDRTPAQVALNWVIRRKGVIAIPKASSPAHVADNAGASGWSLTGKEARQIEEAAMPSSPIAAGTKRIIGRVPAVAGVYTKMSEFRNRRIRKAPSARPPRKG